MRVLALAFTAAILACNTTGGPPARASSPEPACSFARQDSQWLARAIATWRRSGERLLLLDPQPFPLLILFDTRCVYRVAALEPWTVLGEAHGGSILLPNGRAIAPFGVGVTSPTSQDTAIFLAVALPDAWLADTRYAQSGETRAGWEQYLVGAFAHEMAHARMLPAFLPRLRALEAAIYPDTVEDNAIQNRFGNVPDFSVSVARETDLLYRAVTTTNRRTRIELARSALQMMRQRRARYYTGDLEAWSDLEQAFLDMEGIAQWVAFHTRLGTPGYGPGFDRALARFRSTQEFWSEDQGLALVLLLDVLAPGWQRPMLSAAPPSSLDLLTRALDGSS